MNLDITLEYVDDEEFDEEDAAEFGMATESMRVAKMGKTLSKNKALMKMAKFTAKHDPVFKAGVKMGKAIGKKKIKKEYASNDVSLTKEDVQNAKKAMEYLHSSNIKELINSSIIKIASKYEEENMKEFSSYMKHSYGIMKSIDEGKLKSSGKTPAIIIKSSVTTEKAMRELVDIIIPSINSYISSKFGYALTQAKTDKNLYNLEYIRSKVAFESVEESFQMNLNNLEELTMESAETLFEYPEVD